MAASPPPVEVRSESDLGGRLRALRTSRGLSLRAAAAQAGVAPGALSQIETGKNSPSVSTLKKILGAMGVSLGEFFSSGESAAVRSSFIYRSAQLVRIGSGRGLKLVGLPGPASSRTIQFMLETYAPGAGTGAEPYSHEGEEGGFCMSGSLEVTVDGHREVIGPGDAYYYPSKLPHVWRNIGRVPAVVISGCTPPTF